MLVNTKTVVKVERQRFGVEIRLRLRNLLSFSLIELAESIFFGHVRGAFTGAIADEIGYFERANAGTLFLDEIGDMPIETQVKLLRALGERVITPIGGKESKSVWGH